MAWSQVSEKPRVNTVFASLLDSSIRSRSVDQAVSVLKQGGVIVFPTETVYGLGCDYANAGALKRLQRLKQQPTSKPFQLLVGSVEQVRTFFPTLGRIAEKLIRCYWPGPLTLVLPDLTGGTVGVRLPDHSGIQTILRQSGLIMAATSANLHGEAPACSAKEAGGIFGGLADLILDGGNSSIGEASTVVKVDGESLTVLRVGAIAEEAIYKIAQPTLVCVEEKHDFVAGLATGMLQSMDQGRKGNLRVIHALSADSAVQDLDTLRLVLCGMGYESRGWDTADIHLSTLNIADHILVFSKECQRILLSTMPTLESRIKYIPIRSPAIGPEGWRGEEAMVESGYHETAVKLEKLLWTTGIA